MTMKVNEWALALSAHWADDLTEATPARTWTLEASKYDILRAIAEYNGGLTAYEAVSLVRELDIIEKENEITTQIVELKTHLGVE